MSKKFFKTNEVFATLLKKNHVTIHDMQYYIARGLKLHPMLYADYLENLCELERQGKISFTPSMILKMFSIKHNRIYQKQIKKSKQM